MHKSIIQILFVNRISKTLRESHLQFSVPLPNLETDKTEKLAKTSSARIRGSVSNKKICRSCDELRWMNKLEKNQALIDKMNDAFERDLQWTCRQLFKSNDLIC